MRVCARASVRMCAWAHGPVGAWRVRTFARVCVRACACVGGWVGCVRACVRAHARAGVCVCVGQIARVSGPEARVET